MSTETNADKILTRTNYNETLSKDTFTKAYEILRAWAEEYIHPISEMINDMIQNLESSEKGENIMNNIDKHSIDEAVYLVRFGNSRCVCRNCYMIIEGLQDWISNSEINSSYTEDDAVRDFFAATDFYIDDENNFVIKYIGYWNS